MKTSELITDLVSQMSMHGDMEIAVSVDVSELYPENEDSQKRIFGNVIDVNPGGCETVLCVEVTGTNYDETIPMKARKS